jgi:hypothetical protein
VPGAVPAARDAGAAQQPAAPSILDNAQQRGTDRLYVYQGIPSTVVQTGRTVDFTVPREAFAHTDQKAIVHLDAMRANGQPLPDWLDFDPISGKFDGRPPPNAAGVIVIKVVARDNEGREAETTFTVRIGDSSQAPAPVPGKGASLETPLGTRDITADASDVQGAVDERVFDKDGKDGKHNKDGKGHAHNEKVRVAAIPFSEQLKRAAKDPLLSRIMDTRDKVKGKVPVPPARQA